MGVGGGGLDAFLEGGRRKVVRGFLNNRCFFRGSTVNCRVMKERTLDPATYVVVVLGTKWLKGKRGEEKAWARES